MRCMDEFPCMYFYCNQPSDLLNTFLTKSIYAVHKCTLYPYFSLGLSKDLFDINIYSYSSMSKTLCH